MDSTCRTNFLVSKNGINMDFIENAYEFTVEDGNYFNSMKFYPEGYEGVYQKFEIISE